MISHHDGLIKETAFHPIFRVGLSQEQMNWFPTRPSCKHRYVMVRQQEELGLMCAPPRASIPPLSPAGRAPGPPFTPATSRVKETFSQISGMRGSAQPFFSTGSEASSYLTEIKDESALLNKLRALSAKYLGSYLPSRTLLGSQRIRTHFQRSTQCLFSGLGQKDEQPLSRPTGFWTPSKHADQPSAPRTTHMQHSHHLPTPDTFDVKK